MPVSLNKKTILITGSSRGIGREMALRFARDGANLVIAAKSVEAGKLPGTIFSVAEEVEKAGGKALPLQLDVRSDESIQAVVQKTVETFGKIDALINNAGAISLTPLETTPMKRVDLMLDINVRAVLACSHYCIPHLKAAGGGHILNLSPPISLDMKWFKSHVAYTISKYGMTMATMGLSEELRPFQIAVNSLWPRTVIATAAIDMLMGPSAREVCRTPAIMADAAYEILTTDSAALTGQSLLDEPFLRSRGCSDFAKYDNNPGQEAALDLFVDQ